MWRVRQNQNRSSELTHYGVKGMRWGVRKERETSGRKTNGPSIKDRYKSLFNKDQSIRTNIGVVKIDGFDKNQRFLAEQFIKLIDEKSPSRYASIEEAKEKLNEFEKNKNSMAYTRGYNQVSLVNHDAPTKGRLINCFECSMAYEMRNRGYNVQAKDMPGGWSAEVLHAFDVKDGFTLKIDLDRSYAGNRTAAAKEAYDRMAQRCISYGDGARGCLGVQWASGNGGHSMYWIVENGEFKIIDAQDSTRDGYEIFMAPADAVDHNITVHRLDNAEVLPGVTDYVEQYSTVTKEEKDKASKEAYKKTTQNLARVQAQKRNSAEQAKAERMEDVREKTEEQEKNKKNTQKKNVVEQIEKGKKTTSKLLTKVKEVTENLIDKGKETLKKIFKTSTVTWEIID